MDIIVSNLQSLNIRKSTPVTFKSSAKYVTKESSVDRFIETPLSKSLSYIERTRLNLKSQGKELESLSQLDLSKISGILDGLPTFKNFDTNNLGLLNNILIINTQRGCNNGCGHCYLKAKPTNYYKEPTIEWESFKQLFKDFGELNARLGFNVLGKTFGFAYNYADADPIEFCSIDKNGEKHNIAEAAKYFYTKVGKPLDFSTAGWDIDNEFENQAAKDVVELVKTNPETLRNVDISIHPFHKYMLKANKYFEKAVSLKDTDPKLSEEYEQKFIQAREDYVNRMANVIKSFAPIMKPEYSHIDSQYIFEENPYSLFTKKHTEELCEDIIKRAYELCKNENIDSYLLRNGIEAFKKNCMYTPRKVYNTPRISTNPLKTLPNTYTIEENGNRMNIVVEPFDKTSYNFFENEIASNFKATLKEDKNSFSKIILNMNLNNNISQNLKDAGFLNDKEALDNFYERVENTIDNYSAIPEEKLQIRIKYNPNYNSIVSLQEFKKYIKEKYPNIKDIDLRVTKEEKDILPKTENPTQEIVNMINHLNPVLRKNFVSRMKKAIDIDGNLVLLIYNKPYFGTGNFQAVSIKVDDIKFDTNQTYKDKPFTNLLRINL